MSPPRATINRWYGAITTGRVIFTFRGHEGAVHAVFFAGAELLVSTSHTLPQELGKASSLTQTKVWQLKSQEHILLSGSPADGLSGELQVSFSRNGRWLGVATRRAWIYAWDRLQLSGGKPLAIRAKTGWSADTAFHPDEPLLTWQWSGTIWTMWQANLDTHTPRHSLAFRLPDYKPPVRNVVTSPNGREYAILT